MPSTEFRTHAQLILDRLDEAGDLMVCADATRRCTADEFAREIRSFRHTLAARGVKRGELVALIAPNTVTALAVRFAASLTGAVTVVCPGADSPDRLNAFLSGLDPATVVVFEAGAAADITAVAADRIWDATDPMPDLCAAEDPAAEVSVRADDPCILVATGGTTGTSKSSIRDFAAYRHLIGGPSSPTRRQLVCTPLAYIAQTAVDQTLLAGGVVFLHDRFDPHEVLESIERDRITHIALVEPLLVELVDCPTRPDHDLSSLQAVTHVGADAPPELRHRLLTALRPGVLAHVYGASEFGPACALAGADYSLDRPDLLGSAGRALPGVEVRIVDDAGRAMDHGRLGRIEVRSPGAATAYWGARAERDRFHSDGWFRSSDFGEIDEEGYLRVRGREADRRVIDGVPLWPLDIENAMSGHPAVRYAVAAPLDSETADFAVWVVLAPGSGINEQDLRSHLVAVGGPRLADVHLQRVLTMPVTAQGKPDRRRLLSQIGVTSGGQHL
ncbi:class I adenylate-forming enzyme family protein [Gordonia insulae]|uniref:8-demethylnovobiocic acid synthase n=1 Tax=Gordonia insulae TaxID=2420509 RepID=A0A3G8JIY5_9ACTN|nr:class I adenylate-forming enzyme family protein [Gordonia insulae]AZG44565.1 8-demethylnovobiocic acid synthase [Gordonia insulae]